MPGDEDKVGCGACLDEGCGIGVASLHHSRKLFGKFGLGETDGAGHQQGDE